MDTTKNHKPTPLKWLLPVAAVVLIILTIQLLYSRRQNDLRELSPVDGVLDITGENLSNEVINIVNSWDFYPNKLYTSEDFANGIPSTQEEEDTGTGTIRYGTYRLVIKAPPRQYFTICSYSIDYSTRVFVNGVETYTSGQVADNAADSVPQISYMTIPLYSGESGEIEIIYQYSNFVHRDGGFIQPTYLSTPQNMENYKLGNDLVSLTLSGGLLILFLYFILCASIQRRTDFLLLAVCCLMMALRDQNFFHIHFFAGSVSWYVSYRLFMGVTSLLPGVVLLLLHSVYSRAAKRLPALIMIVFLAVAGLCITFLPTIYPVNVCVAAWVEVIPYLFYLAWSMVRYYLREKACPLPDVLTLSGFSLLIFSVLLEGLFVNSNSDVSRYGVMPSGMLMFVLLTAVSISLRIQAREAALAESRSRSELLERMNEMNLDFLHKVAHELKTPLTVISGYAQLTALQFATDRISQETPENLKTIQKEALRLADMVTKLMEYSYGRENTATFGAVDVAPLLKSVEAICTPMCVKNNNHIEIHGKKCAPLYGNAAMLLQVFINLVVNSNRHTKNGVVTISASDTERREYVVFRVKDTGDGIDSSLLPHIFEKGYSGDGGSGLGLAICQEAVEAHGGTLELEHTGPDGTVFTFTVLKKEASK